MHDVLLERRSQILTQNALDVERAQVEVQSGKLSAALLARLPLQKKFDGVLEGLQQVARLPDPVPRISSLSLPPSCHL